MNRLYFFGVVCLSFAPVSVFADVDCNWAGNWNSNRGVISLSQTGDSVTGTLSQSGSMTGESGLNDRGRCEYVGSFTEGTSGKVGQFKLRQNSAGFSGKWGYEGNALGRSWTGTRNNTPVQAAQPNTSGSIRMLDPANHSSTTIVTMAPQEDRVNVTVPVQTRDQKLQETRAKAAERTRQARVGFDIRGDHSSKWKVVLETICTINENDGKFGGGSENGENIYGIAWVRARAIDAKTGKQVNIIPEGGYPSIADDSERAWEQRPNSNIKGIQARLCRPIDKTLIYNFDYRALGYSSRKAMLNESRNRIDVTWALSEYDQATRNDDLGERRKAHSLSDADFCGHCKINNYGDRHPSYKYLPPKEGGQGVFDYYHGETHVRAYYAVQPIDSSE